MKWDPLQRLFLVYRGGDDKQSTQTNVMYSPEEAARRAKVMAEAERVFGMTAGTTPQYPGPAPTPASADTLAAQERLRAFSTGTGQQLAQDTTKATQFGLSDVLYPETNKALQATQAAAIRPVTEAYQAPGGVLSNIRSQFMTNAPSGQSSREAIASGIAGRSYLNTIGDISTNIAFGGYQKGLDTFGRSLALAPQTYALGGQPAVTQGAVGQQQEQYAQQGEQFQADTRSFALNAPWMNLQNYANIVHGGSSAGSQTTSSGGGTTNVQRAGMALSGAALGFQMGGPYGAAAGAGIGLLLGML
jgi:hypothetical protein